MVVVTGGFVVVVVAGAVVVEVVVIGATVVDGGCVGTATLSLDESPSRSARNAMPRPNSVTNIRRGRAERRPSCRTGLMVERHESTKLESMNFLTELMRRSGFASARDAHDPVLLRRRRTTTICRH